MIFLLLNCKLHTQHQQDIGSTKESKKDEDNPAEGLKKPIEQDRNTTHVSEEVPDVESTVEVTTQNDRDVKPEPAETGSTVCSGKTSPAASNR